MGRSMYKDLRGQVRLKYSKLNKQNYNLDLVYPKNAKDYNNGSPTTTIHRWPSVATLSH
jgi:hypothetical protein